MTSGRHDVRREVSDSRGPPTIIDKWLANSLEDETDGRR